MTENINYNNENTVVGNVIYNGSSRSKERKVAVILSISSDGRLTINL